jgi:hypothetical protein
MSDSPAKHFDYLISHGAELEGELGLPGLSKEIDSHRHEGMEKPKYVLGQCRTILEKALSKLAKPLPSDHMHLQEVIEHAKKNRPFLTARPLTTGTCSIYVIK